MQSREVVRIARQRVAHAKAARCNLIEAIQYARVLVEHSLALEHELDRMLSDAGTGRSVYVPNIPTSG